jgi:hypothetical protein
MGGGLMPTYEEAKRCPKCKQPGRLKSVENPLVSPEDRTRFGIQRGAKVETYVCINERCRWFETGWVVQLNPDGSIPDRTQALAKDKQYPALPGWAAKPAETVINDLRRMAQEEEEAQMRRTEQGKK